MTLSVQEQIKTDLLISGLTPADIDARAIEMAERASCGINPTVDGYVIPYFNLAGKSLGFYRCKLFNHGDIRYRQLKGTPNHVYFPPKLQTCLKKSKADYIIFTEGEKKAAACVKAGFPCVAFGGVDSWRNRILLLPKDVEIGAYSYNKELIGVKLPSSTLPSGIASEPVAIGFEDVVNFIKETDKHVIIIYDSDESSTDSHLKTDVQRAASELGFELRRRGIHIQRIRQCILPRIDAAGKTGLDDYLQTLDNAPKHLQALLDACMAKRCAFPPHPNLEEDLNKKLQNAKLTRKDMQRLSLNIITDLDSRGMRMLSTDEGQQYYFENKTSKLIKVDLSDPNPKANSPFNQMLYKRYGLSPAADNRLTKWLATQYAAEDPVDEVSPYRVLARTADSDECIRYQMGDGLYVKITGSKTQPIEILANGSENILFESGHVAGIDPKELLKEFKKRQSEPLHMWWEDVLHEVRLKNHGRATSLYALLYYISPWLYRWRGTQLPVEQIIGEAGSGKSTLCELRLNIITGKPHLRNAPNDLKDWHASIANTGGLHATDNVQLIDKQLRQRLSDEICRLITEPHPSIEQRKYFTNVDTIRMKVDSVFLFTGISQPFSNSDLLQRSIIMELDKLAKDSSKDEDQTLQAINDEKPVEVVYDSTWEESQMAKFGGRTAWVSHHLYVLHKFLELANSPRWNKNYQAKHRLINFEQSLMLMADLFNIDATWIPDHISNVTDNKIVDSDWSLEGIRDFCRAALKVINSPDPEKLLRFCRDINANASEAKRGNFAAADIAVWAQRHEAYMECFNLNNSRKLGRYMSTHKAMIAQTTGLTELPHKVNNRYMYHINANASALHTMEEATPNEEGVGES